MTSQEPEDTLIDRIRHDIQERLDQLLAEAEKLRHALASLGSHDGSEPIRAAKSKASPSKGRRRTRSATPSASPAATASAKQAKTVSATRNNRPSSTKPPTSPARTASGATRS